MTRLFIGHKPGVGGVVKVMKNDGDDPLTTPNTDYGKFLFNSETSKIGYIQKFRQVSYSGMSEGDHFVPAGSSFSSCTDAIGAWSTFQQYFYYAGRDLGRSYGVVAEYRKLPGMGVKITGPSVEFRQNDSDSNAWCGYNISTPTYTVHVASRVSLRYTAQNYSEPIANHIDRFEPSDGTQIFSVLDLPAWNRPLPTTGTPGSGRNTIISPSVVRIAKGGLGESGADRDGIIIDSDRVPMKIVRAGEVVVAGNSHVDVAMPAGVTLTSTSYMDYMVWRTGTALTVPQALSAGNSNGQKFNMSYAIFANYVRIYNEDSESLTVRYMICHDDGETSTGGSKVFDTVANAYTRIKRPGSSDTAPKSRDILLDTRFAYFPILAEGYLDHSEFNEAPASLAYGENAKTINFNAGGLKPFLKYYVARWHPQTSAGFVSEPHSKILRTDRPGDPWAGRQASDGTVALLTDSSVKFHMARGNPYRLRRGNPGNTPEYSDQEKPYGIRYYVFGIPASL